MSLSPNNDKTRPGTLSDGWNRIARDLDRAFALAMLAPTEALILQVAREGCWVLPALNRPKGSPTPEAQPCHVHVSLLARKTGLDRSGLSRGLGNLVRAKLLARHPDDSVLINKDYSSWVYPKSKGSAERPRFTGEQLDYIRAAKEMEVGAVTISDFRPGETAQTVDESQQVDTPDCRRIATGGVDESQQFCRRIATPTVDELQQNGVPPLEPPYKEERVRESESDIYIPRENHSQPLRPSEDFDDVRRAVRVLDGDLRTQHLGQRLLQEHNTTGVIAIAGWQLLLAANKQVGTRLNQSQRQNWNYFVATARNTGEDERDQPTYAPTDGPSRPTSPTLTPSEARRKRQNDLLDQVSADLQNEGD